MRGMLFAGAIWVVAILAAHEYHRRTGRAPSLALDRPKLALALLLLALHAVAGSTSAEEILQNPVVLERAARGALAGLAGLIVLPLLVPRLRTMAVSPLPGFTALIIYLFVAGVSTVYSIAPVVTLGKFFELAVGMAIVATVLLGPNAQRGLRDMVKYTVYLEGVLVAVAVVGFFALPDTFARVQPRPGFIFRETMGAPYSHSNVLAAWGGLLAAYALASFFEEPGRVARRWWLAAFGGSSVAVILASGRQGVIIWAISIAILLFLYRRALFVAAIIPTAAFGIVRYADTLWRAFNRDAEYHLTTLTGRLAWWEAALQVWREHPWTGYGFGAGGRFAALASIGRRGSNVHSGYLEALIGVGLLGVVPFAFAILWGVAWAAKSLLRRVDVRYAILLVPIILRTAVDLGFGAWLKPDFIILACVIGMADLAYRERRQRRRMLDATPGPPIVRAGSP